MGGYVLVELPTGYVATALKPVDVIKGISEACEEGQCRNVLITGKNVRVNLSVVDLLNRAQHVDELKARIAVVAEHDLPLKDVKFLEDATSLGATKIKLFDRIDEAKAWLGVE